VTTQISDFGRAQRRVRSAAPDSDRAAVATVEPVPRIALTRQEACASLGSSAVYFVQEVSPHLRVARKWASVKQGSSVGNPTLSVKLACLRPGTRALGRAFRRTSPALMLALSFGGQGGFRGA
jgi:hypothetical protein